MSRSLRGAVIEAADLTDDAEMRQIIEMPLTAAERQDIRDRARLAADAMEKEAAETWNKIGPKLSTDARVALARSIDQAGRMRALADALEGKQ